jgi:two-component system nitrogen regulation response regulator NtrX
MNNKQVNRNLIYVVDDDARLGDVLRMILNDAGYESESFVDGASGLAAVKSRTPALVLLDFMLPDADGVDLLKKMREIVPDLPVIMISGQGTIKVAVDALRLGAFDFLEKPLDADRIMVTVRNALTSGRLQQQVGRLRQELEGQFQMVGESPALQRVRDLIARVAPTTASVLITGESGVGKELVARAVHLQSPRAGEPFAALNCAAIPRELIESELFGYEKGAFTGAGSSRNGKLQEADGGTLFLDEIGDMSIEAQAKLLRFLERTEVQRLGGTEMRQLDVRIVAATNKDLAAAVQEGKFRDDLFHRLNVVEINVPPLRERPTDIELLANSFLEHYRQIHDRSLALSPECWSVLMAYEWPGNIRELRNVVERMVILSETNPVEPEECRSFLGAGAKVPTEGTLKVAIERAEREAIERVLQQTHGNVTEAARILGIVRASLYRIMKRYGIASQTPRK